MAVSDAVNPNFDGFVTAKAIKGSNKTTRSRRVESQVVYTQGTTEVNVFGTTNTFAGSVVAMRVWPRDSTACEIQLWSGYSDHRTPVVRVAKNVTAVGAVTGSMVTVSGSFIAGGTLTVVSNTAGEAMVEVLFEPLTPTV